MFQWMLGHHGDRWAKQSSEGCPDLGDFHMHVLSNLSEHLFAMTSCIPRRASGCTAFHSGKVTAKDGVKLESAFLGGLLAAGPAARLFLLREGMAAEAAAEGYRRPTGHWPRQIGDTTARPGCAS